MRLGPQIEAIFMYTFESCQMACFDFFQTIVISMKRRTMASDDSSEGPGSCADDISEDINMIPCLDDIGDKIVPREEENQEEFRKLLLSMLDSSFDSDDDRNHEDVIERLENPTDGDKPAEGIIQFDICFPLLGFALVFFFYRKKCVARGRVITLG